MATTFDWIAFAGDLLATLVGVGVGFLLAREWDRRKGQQEEERTRQRVAKALLDEIGRMQEKFNPALETTPNRGKEPEGSVDVEMDLPLLVTSAFDSAVHSGHLSLLEADLQGELSAFYEQVRLAKLHVPVVVTSYAQRRDVDENLQLLETARDYLDGFCEALAVQAPALLKELEGLRAQARRPRVKRGQAGQPVQAPAAGPSQA